MLDNLRDETSSKPFFEDDSLPQTEAVEDRAAPRRKGQLFGMTPIQRFIIVLLLMLMTCGVGMMCLLLTGKIGIYF